MAVTTGPRTHGVLQTDGRSPTNPLLSGLIGATELDHLVREPSLIQDDDRVVLEPDDAVRLEVPKRGLMHQPYVPSSHEARYFACSSVSWSIEIPIVASLSRAISSSIAFGTT